MTWIRSLRDLKKPNRFFVLAVALCAWRSASLWAADTQVRDPLFPVFVASRANPNDYAAFATSGWDGNWYVGYNNIWIKKLPPIPPGRYAHAYLGAKVGRAKLLPPVGRPPVFTPIPGSLWMAIASTPAWTADDKRFLSSTHDIPAEGSPEYPLEITGEAQWFWTEIPLSSVHRDQDNYVALWSDTPGLTSVSSSPVLAAAVGGKDNGTWILNNAAGAPPSVPRSPPGTPISFFQPAIALKLIPEQTAHQAPKVSLISWTPGTPDLPKPVLTANVQGASIDHVWVEYLASGIRRGDVVQPTWKPVGRPLWKAPFTFTLAQEELPQGKVQLRVAALDDWGAKGVSDAFTIEVNTVKP